MASHSQFCILCTAGELSAELQEDLEGLMTALETVLKITVDADRNADQKGTSWQVRVQAVKAILVLITIDTEVSPWHTHCITIDAMCCDSMCLATLHHATKCQVEGSWFEGLSWLQMFGDQLLKECLAVVESLLSDNVYAARREAGSMLTILYHRCSSPKVSYRVSCHFLSQPAGLYGRYEMSGQHVVLEFRLHSVQDGYYMTHAQYLHRPCAMDIFYCPRCICTRCVARLSQCVCRLSLTASSSK